MRPACAATAPRRLCYAGTVVHANPTGVLESRVPLLAGAELFGANDVEADAEVVGADGRCAALRRHRRTGHRTRPRRNLPQPRRRGGTSIGAREQAVFVALQRKAQARSRRTARRARCRARSRAAILALPDLLGDVDVLDRAREAFSWTAAPACSMRSTNCRSLARAVAQRCEHVKLRFDLCELTGYGYHTGRGIRRVQRELRPRGRARRTLRRRRRSRLAARVQPPDSTSI